MIRKLLNISERQDKILQELSQKFGISFAELVRRILDEYIKKNYGKDS
jgi:hypothetical protein